MRKSKGLSGNAVNKSAENTGVSSTDVTGIPPAQLLFITPPTPPSKNSKLPTGLNVKSFDNNFLNLSAQPISDKKFLATKESHRK